MNKDQIRRIAESAWQEFQISIGGTVMFILVSCLTWMLRNEISVAFFVFSVPILINFIFDGVRSIFEYKKYSRLYEQCEKESS